MKTTLIIGMTLGACLFVQASGAAYAQQVTNEAPAEFSADIESLPPQPVQSTPPAEEPSEGLSPLTPEPQVTTSVGQLDVEPQQVPHSGQYYDPDSIVPSEDLKSAVGPREVDPRYELGSSFVVVRKAAGSESVQARIVAAQRALSLGRYTSALELYEQLYKKQPKNKRVLMGLAVAQQHSGFVESAIATYEELLKLDPKNTDATANMLGLVKAQYPSVAYRKLRELWEKNSQSPAIAAQLGLTSASIGNTDDAIRYLGVAASLEPQNASHYYNMAVISDQLGAHKEAVELYQKALEVDVAHGGGRSIPREQVYDRLANLRRL